MKIAIQSRANQIDAIISENKKLLAAISRPNLYVMQSIVDATVIKTLWAKDLDEVASKIGSWYVVGYINKHTPELANKFDRYTIYTTRRNFQHSIGEVIPYKGEPLKIVQKRLENDHVCYRLENGSIVNQHFIRL
jgi:hypothetical protein